MKREDEGRGRTLKALVKGVRTAQVRTISSAFLEVLQGGEQSQFRFAHPTKVEVKHSKQSAGKLT